ncbi:hypothetical protein XA26_06090 [Mycolicibacterium fortuitum]|uniref:Uncharacterized protein n=2 Tax=Mycolicibacterium fortuitum TaxID=1766 RepID=A0A0N9XB95_MYCFO|nr:hypothetical protein XA26_06090 [Mycolicibacterium fortuitum]
MPEHRRMRNWASSARTKPPRPSKATKKLQAAIAERRQAQKQIAQKYAARRDEAAGWARNERDKRAAAERAKLAEQGVTFDAKTGEPVLTIRQEAKPDNPS